MLLVGSYLVIGRRQSGMRVDWQWSSESGSHCGDVVQLNWSKRDREFVGWVVGVLITYCRSSELYMHDSWTDARTRERVVHDSFLHISPCSCPDNEMVPLCHQPFSPPVP